MLYNHFIKNFVRIKKKKLLSNFSDFYFKNQLFRFLLKAFYMLYPQVPHPKEQ